MCAFATSREVHLLRRPVGWPEADDFALVTVDVAAPDDGEVVVRNRFVSVDPYMRGRMNEGRSYLPAFELNAVMEGAAVGQVVASASERLTLGDEVIHTFGWREYARGEARSFRKLEALEGVPVSAYLGVLGTTGLTAYVGLLDVAQLRSGDVVFVSAAAGAVGSIAGQLARVHGAQAVIGSAGSDEKVAMLTGELGFDRAFNYRAGDVGTLLAEAAGARGIEVYFDNVGGDHLEAAIARLTVGGRVALCGAISQYNAREPAAAPRNLGLAITKRLTLRGFIVTDHFDRFAAFLEEVGPLVRDGRLVAEETVVDGIEHAVDAFLDMMRGRNRGKMLVRVSA